VGCEYENASARQGNLVELLITIEKQ
jgi:hypothetical protein